MNIVEFPAWLKGLRLHKYSQLFQSMSYEGMLNMDEKWLEDRVSSAYNDNSSNYDILSSVFTHIVLIKLLLISGK